jgi:hypothetical protein
MTQPYEQGTVKIVGEQNLSNVASSCWSTFRVAYHACKCKNCLHLVRTHRGRRGRLIEQAERVVSAKVNTRAELKSQMATAHKILFSPRNMLLLLALDTFDALVNYLACGGRRLRVQLITRIHVVDFLGHRLSSFWSLRPYCDDTLSF